MSRSNQTLLNAATSAAATGSWYQTNQVYSHSEQITVYSSCTGGTAGDYYLEAAVDEAGDITVCVAPFTVGSSQYKRILGHFPYVRAQKKVNAPGCKIVLVDM